MRRVPLSGRTAIDVRAEIFNLLNTPPLGEPNAARRGRLRHDHDRWRSAHDPARAEGHVLSDATERWSDLMPLRPTPPVCRDRFGFTMNKGQERADGMV